MMLSCHRNERGHRASGPRCVPEQKVMTVPPWITPVGLGCHGSLWFIPSRRDLPWEEVRYTWYTARSTRTGPSLMYACATHIQTWDLRTSTLFQYRQMYTHSRGTHTNTAHNLKVISATAASVCLQARQTANKRPISRAIHLWGCFAEWVDLNGCRLLQEARLEWGDSTPRTA